MGSYGDGVGGWSVPNRRPSQYPYTVLSPTFQFIDHETSPVIDFNDRCLTVGSSCFNHLQLVIYNVSAAPLCSWWFPAHLDRGWTYRFSGHIAWGSPGYYGGVSILTQKRKAYTQYHRLPMSSSSHLLVDIKTAIPLFF